MRAKLGWMLLTLAAVAAAAGPSASAQDITAISEIRQESTERSTRLVVQCTGPLAYTYYSPDPLTLVVDVPEVDASRLPSRINVGTKEVESVRVTSMARADGRNLARLEVRLASLVPYQIYSKEKSLFLIFERQAEAATSTSATKPAAPPQVASVDAPPAAEPVADTPTPRAPEAKPAEPRAEAKPAAAAKSAANAPRATRILNVAQTNEGGQLAVTVKADGALRFQDFFLGNPDRLVVDFNDVTSRATLRSLDVNDGPVRKVRLAQFSTGTPKVARLVLDLKNRAPYHIVEAEDGVRIVFGEGQTPSPAPLAALRVDPDPMPEPLTAPPPVAATILPTPAPRSAEPVAQQAPRTESFAPTTVGGTQKQYVGHPISLDFKDGDLQDIFRLFADISGLNVVVNPGVAGKVTLKLVEVPWDQALDLILKTNGLGYTLEENVIRIAPLAALQREESDKRKLQDEKALAGDLHVVSKRLSYAKAVELEPTIKKVALSPRGTITLDSRTNTMIITDLAPNLEKAKDLIAELDRATLQVEIEARIVVTSRNFTRDLGIQWGFNQQRTAQFGNTTNQSFPNAYIINGQGVPATGGLRADQNGAASSAGIGSVGRGYFVNMPAAGFNSALGISMGNILGNFNIDAALTALERQGRGRLLSTPKVTTQNNLAATIKQGTQIPIQTVANNTVTVTFKDAVLTLAVTPQITEAGTVILKVTVDNNSADFANLVNGIPPINTQSADTTVLVKDGSTAVIGGIYQSSEQTAQQSTPVLGHLPLLGYLFRNRFVTNSNNELLIFITPRIIRS